jgi:hypothetical protein
MKHKSIEKNSTLRKILGLISLVAIIANIILRFATKTYGDLTFWIVIIIVAIIAWPVMNWLKK